MTLSLGFSVDVVSSLRSGTEDPLFFIVIKVLTAFPFINNLYKKPGSLHSSLLSFIPLICSSISWQLPFEKEKKKEKSRKGRQIYHSPTEQCARKSAEQLRAQSGDLAFPSSMFTCIHSLFPVHICRETCNILLSVIRSDYILEYYGVETLDEAESQQEAVKYIKIMSLAQTKGMRQLSNRLSSVDSVVDTDNSGMCIRVCQTWLLELFQCLHQEKEAGEGKQLVI